MTYIAHNIKYLRHHKGLTQGALAKEMGVSRSVIGAYEENRAEPKISTLQKMSDLFNTSLDQLINLKLDDNYLHTDKDVTGESLRILSITVDQNDKEYMSVVPEKAEAGYAHSYGDPEYIEELPRFSLPLSEIYPHHTHRLFQISGDSMLPIPSGSYIITSYLEDWTDIKAGESYIIVTKSEGIVFKRVVPDYAHKKLLLKSDNPLYKPYDVAIEDVAEVWKAIGHISFDLSNKNAPLDQQIMRLQDMIESLHEEVISLSKKKSK